MFDMTAQDVRRFFADVWKNRDNPNLGAMERKVLGILLSHPEYAPYLERVEDYLDADWPLDGGKTNPFLHLSLHLSVQEQADIDQPRGVRAIYERLIEQTGSRLEAEHMMMGPLAEMVWQAQRHGGRLDVNDYVTNLRKLVGMGQEDERRMNPDEVDAMPSPFVIENGRPARKGARKVVKRDSEGD